MMGWESFTDNVIFLLSRSPNPIVFLLWGAFAQSKASFITAPHHLVLKAPHPSPLSAYRGFLAANTFQKPMPFCRKQASNPLTGKSPIFKRPFYKVFNPLFCLITRNQKNQFYSMLGKSQSHHPMNRQAQNRCRKNATGTAYPQIVINSRTIQNFVSPPALKIPINSR